MIPAVFNWSGGKDSSLALYRVLRDRSFQIKYLLTTVSEETNRVVMHGVPIPLIRAQAQAIGIPLIEVLLPASPDNSAYEKAMSTTLQELRQQGIETAIYGDIFLEDLRQYRENKLKELQFRAEFPLWGEDTRKLMGEFLALGFKSRIVCTNEDLLSAHHCGAVISQDWIDGLPANVDPCGENGEYHSFVFDGPLFKHAVAHRLGTQVLKQYNGHPPSTFRFQEILA